MEIELPPPSWDYFGCFFGGSHTHKNCIGHRLFVFMRSTSDLSDRSNLSDAGDLSNLSGPSDPSDPSGPSDPSALSDPSGPSNPPKKYPAGQTGGGGLTPPPPFP